MFFYPDSLSFSVQKYYFVRLIMVEHQEAVDLYKFKMKDEKTCRTDNYYAELAIL